MTCKQTHDNITIITACLLCGSWWLPAQSAPTFSYSHWPPNSHHQRSPTQKMELQESWLGYTLATERSIPLIPVNNISVEESYQRFCGAIQKAARHSIPRGFRPTYTPCLDEECQDLLKQYDESGDPDIADHLIESLDAARRHRWEELTSKMNLTHSSWKFDAAQPPPKSTHQSVSANAVAAHLIQVAT